MKVLKNIFGKVADIREIDCENTTLCDIVIRCSSHSKTVVRLFTDIPEDDKHLLIGEFAHIYEYLKGYWPFQRLYQELTTKDVHYQVKVMKPFVKHYLQSHESLHEQHSTINLPVKAPYLRYTRKRSYGL